MKYFFYCLAVIFLLYSCSSEESRIYDYIEELSKLAKTNNDSLTCRRCISIIKNAKKLSTKYKKRMDNDTAFINWISKTKNLMNKMAYRDNQELQQILDSKQQIIPLEHEQADTFFRRFDHLQYKMEKQKEFYTEYKDWLLAGNQFMMQKNDTLLATAIKTNITKLISERNAIIFESLNKSINHLKTDKNDSYTEILYDIKTIKRIYRKIAGKYLSKEDKQRLLNILKELETFENDIEVEQYNYENLINDYQNKYSLSEAQDEIDEINKFLGDYPYSIKKQELLKRLEYLSFVTFETIAYKSVNNIIALNHQISDSKRLYEKHESLLNRLKDNNVKINWHYNWVIKNRIKQLDNLRYNVLKTEYSFLMSDLQTTLQDKAIEYCKQEVHHICRDILKVKPLNDSPFTRNFPDKGNVVEIEQNFSRTYEIINYGGFACSTLYRTVIEVTATIAGNKEFGLKISYIAELKSDKTIAD